MNIASRTPETWKGRALRRGADLAAASAGTYLGHHISPVVGMAAGPALGYITDRLVAPVTGAAGNPAIERFGAPPVKATPNYGTPLLTGVYSAQNGRETERPSYREDDDIIAPYSAGATQPPAASRLVMPPPAMPPATQDEDVTAQFIPGGRTAYRKGGRVATGIEPLVQNLMTGYKKAKAAEVATTKPLLQHPDQTIVRALRVAKKAI